MDRTKTLLTYALLIVVFFGVSILLENGLVMTMYTKISGEFNGHYSVTNTNFEIKDISAKATNINGYISFYLINTTGSFVDKCFLKINLYNERELLADTKYVEISNMQIDESKLFNIKFKANNIENFDLSIVENIPDKSNIINVLGWEIDLTNVFGHDLSNMTIFGTKLKDIFSLDNMKSTGHNFWTWILITFGRYTFLEYFVVFWVLFF